MEDTREDGQILPLIALVIVGAACAVLIVAALGDATVRKADAVTAADAAALAGAASGAASADRLARANGAELADYQRLPGGDVRVVVERDGAQASARARRSSASAVASGELAPAMRAAIRRAESLLGQPVPIVSGYRSPAAQRRLWEGRATNPYPVAAPGSSQHERGLAIDVPRTFVATLLTVAADAGLCQPLAASDPVHFELCGRRFTASAHG